MHEGTLQLEKWHEFYLLIGTAGMTLTGLLFAKVPRLVRTNANRRKRNHPAPGGPAFR